MKLCMGARVRKQQLETQGLHVSGLEPSEEEEEHKKKQSHQQEAVSPNRPGSWWTKPAHLVWVICRKQQRTDEDLNCELHIYNITPLEANSQCIGFSGCSIIYQWLQWNFTFPQDTLSYLTHLLFSNTDQQPTTSTRRLPWFYLALFSSLLFLDFTHLNN